MPSFLRQLHKPVCRLLGLTLVVWLSVSAQPGCPANCVMMPAAHDPEALRFLRPAASQSSATSSGLSPCHQSSDESNILAPALSCPTHAQLTGSMPCCSHAPLVAHTPKRSAPERIITEQGGEPLLATREVSVVHSLALHDNLAERREVYLRHCVLLI
jgi:hypothetical protein